MSSRKVLGCSALVMAGLASVACAKPKPEPPGATQLSQPAEARSKKSQRQRPSEKGRRHSVLQQELGASLGTAPPRPKELTEEIRALFQIPELSLYVPYEFRRSHGWLTWAVAYPVRNHWEFELVVFRNEDGSWIHSKDRRVNRSVSDLAEKQEVDALLKKSFDRIHPRVLPRPDDYVPPENRSQGDFLPCQTPRFDDAIIVAPPQGTPTSIVNRWETDHKLKLPACYREYVTQYGASMYGGAVTIIPPEEIDQERESRNSHWLTDPDDRWFKPLVLDHKSLLETVPIATTSLGDYGEWIVFHPSDPATIYVVQDIGVKIIGKNLDEALRWVYRNFPPMYPDRQDIVPRSNHNAMFTFSSITSSEPQTITVRDGKLSEPLKFTTSHQAEQIVSKAKQVGLPFIERRQDDMHELFFPSFGGVLSAWDSGARVDSYIENPKGIERVTRALKQLGLRRGQERLSHSTESEKTAVSENEKRFRRLRAIFQRLARLGGVFHGDCPKVMSSLRTEAQEHFDQFFQNERTIDDETRRLVDDATNRCLSCDASTKMMCVKADRIFFDLY